MTSLCIELTVHIAHYVVSHDQMHSLFDAGSGSVRTLCYFQLRGIFKKSPDSDNIVRQTMPAQMRDDEGLCEELALELVDQQEPVRPSTKDKHLLPLTEPLLQKIFVWGKKKGGKAVRAFFKNRQYI